MNGPSFGDATLRAELTKALVSNVQVEIERIEPETYRVTLRRGKIDWSINHDPQDWGDDAAAYALKVLQRAPQELVAVPLPTTPG